MYKALVYHGVTTNRMMNQTDLYNEGMMILLAFDVVTSNLLPIVFYR